MNRSDRLASRLAGIQVEVPEQFAELKERAQAAGNAIPKKMWGDETSHYGSRWRLVLTGFRPYWSADTFEFAVVPKTGRPITETTDYGGYSRTDEVYRYPEPPGVVGEIDERPGHVYRGMSMEEWVSIQKNGFVQSKGSYNLEQEGLTFYGKADTGAYYATGFAPLSFKPSRQKPGVIIEIPDQHVMTNEQRKDIPESEFAHEGQLPASNITRAWMVVPTRVRPGKVEVREQHNQEPKYVEGSRSDPSIGYVLVPMKGVGP